MDSTFEFNNVLSKTKKKKFTQRPSSKALPSDAKQLRCGSNKQRRRLRRKLSKNKHNETQIFNLSFDGDCALDSEPLKLIKMEADAYWNKLSKGHIFKVLEADGIDIEGKYKQDVDMESNNHAESTKVHTQQSSKKYRQKENKRREWSVLTASKANSQTQAFFHVAKSEPEPQKVELIKLSKTTFCDNNMPMDQSNVQERESTSSPSQSSIKSSVNKIITSKLDKMKAKMQQRLSSAKFRLLNEALYTTNIDEDSKTFGDPLDFEIYHKGFQAQVAHWPVNPLDKIINGLKKNSNALSKV